MEDSPDQSPLKKKRSQYDTWLRYSSLALQILLTITVCGWLGYKLDQYLRLNIPIFMLLFGLLGFGGVMYKVYRSVTRE